MVMISWMSFLIPPECVPGRSGLLVTLLLVLTTCYIHELNTSPSVKGTTPLIIWNGICLLMIVFALLEYAGILYAIRFGQSNDAGGKSDGCNTLFSGKEKNIKNLRNKYDISRQILNCRQYGREGSMKRFKTAGDKNARQWPLIIDRYSLIFTPSLFIVVALTYWTYFYPLD